MLNNIITHGQGYLSVENFELTKIVKTYEMQCKISDDFLPWQKQVKGW